MTDRARMRTLVESTGSTRARQALGTLSQFGHSINPQSETI